MSKTIIFWVEVVVFLVIPTILFSLNSRFFALRHIVMGLGGLYSVYRLLHSQATLSSLGIRITNFYLAIKSLAIPSLVLVVISLEAFLLLPTSILKIVVGYDPFTVQSIVERILTYVLLSAPIQELIFRGYITWRIKEVYQNSTLIQLLSVTFFTFVHLPFYSPLLVIITIIMGLIYIKNYQQYQNLFAPIVSHAFVGACILIIRNAWFPYI